MSSFETHLTSLVIFVPLLIAVLIALLPAGERGQLRAFTFVGMLVDLLLAGLLCERRDGKR